jgi:hypothetical protein
MSKKAAVKKAETVQLTTIREKMIELENLIGYVMQINKKQPGQLVALQRELQSARTNDHPLLDFELTETE